MWDRAFSHMRHHFWEHPAFSGIRDALTGRAVAVRFVENSAALVAVDLSDGFVELAIDRLCPAASGSENGPAALELSLSQDGLELLLGLGLVFVLLRQLGAPPRRGLECVAELFLELPPDQRRLISRALALREIDPGALFSLFLARIESASSPEDRKLAITWLLGQDRVDLPYDRATVSRILNSDGDADRKRALLYAQLRAYDTAVEQRNIERIAAEVREAGEFLVFGRMSRAFLNQGLLLADAVLLKPDPTWPGLAEQVDGLSPGDRETANAGECLRLLLTTDREVPLTQFEGALERFEEATLEALHRVLLESLQPARARVENHAEYADGPRPPLTPHTAFESARTRLKLADRIRESALQADSRAAAYVVISQRPSSTGSHLLVKLNEFEDPYAGKPDNLRKLFRLAGDRLYASPDYRWLEVADHWIEAIPLFIREAMSNVEGRETTRTVVDIAGMETAFREEMADRWACNLQRVLVSEWLALARETLADAGETLDDATIRSRLTGLGTDPREIAALGVLFEECYRRDVEAIQRCIEQEDRDPYEAARLILSKADLVTEARYRCAEKGSWLTAVEATLRESGWHGDFARAVAALVPEALAPRRPLPALHVLTTQSAGMTEGYIESWLEESMALYNLVEHLGLQGAVEARRQFQADRIIALCRKVVCEMGYAAEADELMANDEMSEAEASYRVVRRNPLLGDEVARLGTLLEMLETPEAATPPDHVDDPELVRSILIQEAAELRAAALARLTHHKALGSSAPEDLGSGREARQCAVAEDEALSRDLDAFIRLEARRRALARLDAAHPDLKLADRCRSFLRRWKDLEKTTARRTVVSAQGLSHLTTTALHSFRATGGRKRYHLLYTPSRVDLGARERESVESWSQWVGGADRAAARVGRQFYQLINKNVQVFESLAEPEVLKTGENASMVAHYAFSNALSMMMAVTRKGDIEVMADQMNRRRDRRVHPAGEGYGGYCVPKDGLFLEFVLSLAREEKLAQIGLPAADHQSVLKLARELLDRRGDFLSPLDWEALASERMQRAAVSEADFSSAAYQATRIARILDKLGVPELRDPARVAATLAARWSLHKMVTGGEQINRFMPFFKVWLIRQALSEAAVRAPGGTRDIESSTVVLTGEYKPDTQDGRFSAGMRKFEILSGTGGHLLSALDAEGQDLAGLLTFGYRQLEASGRHARILEWLDVTPADRAAATRLDELFPSVNPPAEIRVVAPTGLSTLDLLNYTGNSALMDAADHARTELLAAGFGSAEIAANLATHGPRLFAWASRQGIAPELRQALQVRLGGALHALALADLGPESDYPSALRGADVLDAGIPHRALLDLLADPGHLCDLMLDGNPRSALAIVDGTSGARPRAMNQLDVMLWFAAGDRRGREPVYVAIGLGADTIEGWRAAMRRRRRLAEELRSALTGTSRIPALKVYETIVRDLQDDATASVQLGDAERLARSGRLRERDTVCAQALARIVGGLPLDALDFNGFLALGGFFLLVGDEPDAIAACRSSLAQSLPGDGGSLDVSWQVLLPRVARQPTTPAREHRGVESSNKAMEEGSAAALATRRQLSERLATARGLKERKAAFRAAAVSGKFSEAYDSAMSEIGTGDETVGEGPFGRFIAWTRQALFNLAQELDDEALRAAFITRVGTLCDGGRVDAELWQSVAGGYEDIGDFGRLAQQVTERCRQAKANPEQHQRELMRVARGAELFQILLAVDSIHAAVEALPDGDDAAPLWRALAEFFAKTVNDHHYEYRPWLYSRGIGFASLSGNELYQWAGERHAWLHRYLRAIALRHTELRELPEGEQDALLGNALDEKAVQSIGAEADDPDERTWRSYGQLRELAFIRNDGFPLPLVFMEFDPELIHDRSRVNHIVAAPVGRTHFSRMLAEGPTLNREFEADGRFGANLIISRTLALSPDERSGRTLVQVRSGHLYVDVETFRQAIARYRPGTTAPDIHPKGIRLAVRFTRPVLASLVYPFHGDPIYTSGALEDAGLPYTVQSLFHTWTTYDKAKYPEIFRDSGVEVPAEIDWLAAWTAERDEAAAKACIREGLSGTGYAGLAAFAARHSSVIVKDAAESGGRGMRIFQLRTPGTGLDAAQMAAAVGFVYQLSRSHNVTIQELIHGSPEFWATEEFMEEFVRRQIVDWGRPIERRREPCTPIYGSIRVIVSTDRPTMSDPEVKWHLSHWIALLSQQPITNIGRGGSLEQLGPEFIRACHRDTLLRRLSDAARRAAEALSNCEEHLGATYEQETGRAVGTDLTGVSYGRPRYLMLDFLVVPVFAGNPEQVEVRATHDCSGHRTGSEFLLIRGKERWTDEPLDWRVVLIEPNVGVGLWDRVALREEAREKERARAAHREPDWTRVGEQARIVLRDLHAAGEEYLQTMITRSLHDRLR